jgi:hypothetical protein
MCGSVASAKRAYWAREPGSADTGRRPCSIRLARIESKSRSAEASWTTGRCTSAKPRMYTTAQTASVLPSISGKAQPSTSSRSRSGASRAVRTSSHHTPRFSRVEKGLSDCTWSTVSTTSSRVSRTSVAPPRIATPEATALILNAGRSRRASGQAKAGITSRAKSSIDCMIRG